MPEITIPMVEIEYCLICHKHIGKGNDPAICDKKSCYEIFMYEVNFNKFAREQMERMKDENSICRSTIYRTGEKTLWS